MRLERVTITGADDSVTPDILLALNQAYPFCEWGILTSLDREGPRYPSATWRSHVQDLAARHTGIRLALHVCGLWVRELLMGEITMPLSMLACVQRVQLNFGGKRWPCNPERFPKALAFLCGSSREVIFQLDGVMGQTYYQIYHIDYGNAVPLFDRSCGRGMLPDAWPAPCAMADDRTHELHGYAGGLTPDNLLEELGRISAVAGDCRVWIDLESGVRTNDRFDLGKVVRVLELTAPLIAR